MYILSLYIDRKSTRLNSSHLVISYAVFCLKKKKTDRQSLRQRLPIGGASPPLHVQSPIVRATEFYPADRLPGRVFFFFFNEPGPPEIYPLPLHAAFPI